MKKRLYSGDVRWQQGATRLDQDPENDGLPGDRSHASVRLCAACQETFKNDASIQPKWTSSCYGHIWYLLKSCTGEDLDFVISTLPWSVRYWWFHKEADIPSAAYAKMMPRRTGNNCIEPVFQDVTPVRNKLKERLGGSNIRGRNLIRLLPKHFPDDKAEFIGYQHLYASKLKRNYTSFLANKMTFQHSRGNWPSASTFMKRPTAAGLYMSEKGGNKEKI
jgi:hypothetical protein